MSFDDVSVIVAGGLGTDIFALGLNRIVGQGELSFGGQLRIGAGGKSRNIAQMMACFLGPGRVAMVGRTSIDPLNLWQVPVDALKAAGVNVEFTKTIPFEESGKFPQVALIAVDQKGNNQIYVVPGINEDFCEQDIVDAIPLFDKARQNNGVLVLSLELPLPTAITAVKQANEYGLRVILDPGGIRPELDHSELLQQGIFLIKPNEHEARILTGIEVKDRDDAQEAATKLLDRGIENALITLGGNGAHLVADGQGTHMPIPSISYSTNRDETGCGDQTIATLCACLVQGDSLQSATQKAILAGTMQFYREGIVPVTKDELDRQYATTIG